MTAEKKHFKESIDTFKVKFEGGNTIDAEIFTKTINNTVELLKSSSQAINSSGFLRLEIRATKEGSFDVILDAIARYSVDLITTDNIRLARDIIEGFLCFLDIKERLKGKKPKKIENKDEFFEITTQDDEKILAKKEIGSQYFKDCTVEQTIINMFSDLKISDRDGLEIKHHEKSVKFERINYENMATKILDNSNDITSTTNSQIMKDCQLTIKKPDLIGTSKWEVIFDKKIDVKINDQIFLKNVREGEIKLTGGCRLICDLLIETELNSEFSVIAAEYTVIKVHDIQHKQAQLNLPLQ